MDKKLLNDLKKDIYQIVNDYRAYLIQKCNNFKNFTGRDIDAFYIKKKRLKRSHDNIIIINKDNNDLRLHINHPKHINFLSLDIEELSSMPKAMRHVFTKKFNKKILCKHTKLNHLDNKSIIFYKLYKYFFITINSYDQLRNLKKDINKLNKQDFFMIVNSVEKALPNQYQIINKFLFWEIEKFCKNKKVDKFFSILIQNRHKKRKIFKGNLKFKNIFFSKKFFYALLLGSRAKWKYTHNSMPAIAIIGNDGSGKTTVTEYIRKNFSKMDPLIIDMKGNKPFFYLVSKFRNVLKKSTSFVLVKKIYFLKVTLLFLGELLDLFDKYVKYKIGMAWADAGYGLTIFERYPTDRVRGEFPNINNKLLPLEQFFPFPDGMIYLDVLPLDSINRKKKDNHTLDEMKSKRKNYLSLIKEFDEVKMISYSKNINQNILKIKNYIFKLYLKKKNIIKKNKTNKRMKWKKNYNRILAGKDLDRSQKESFFK
jgi:thymidylate kinase